jgi:phage-related minor tail protein
VTAASASLGSAWVEVTADASNVASQMRDDVSDAVKQIIRIFERGFEAVAADAEKASGEVETALADGGKQGAEKMSSSAEEGGGKLVGRVKEIAAAAAAAFGAAFVVDQYMQFQDASAMLDAQMGNFGKDAGVIGKAAGEIYAANFGDSLDTVGEAARGVSQQLGIAASEADFKPVTEGILSLSQAFGQDLAGTTNAVAQMMRTGLAPDAKSALDIITVGFQDGAGATDDYLDTLNEYSVQFQKLGIDGSQATGLLVQGLQAGARNTDLVADAFKEFSIRAVDGSKTTAQGFEAIGLNADQMASRIGKGGTSANAALSDVLTSLKNMKDPVQQSQAAVALFGTQAEDLGSALYALDPATASSVAHLDDTKGAAEQLGNTMSDTLSNKIETAKRAVGAFASQSLTSLIQGFSDGKASGEGITRVFTTIGAVLRGTFDWITGTAIPALQSFAGWMERNKTPILIVAGIITALFIPHLIALAIQAGITKVATAAMWLASRVGAIRAAIVHSAQITWMIARWVALGAAAALQGLKIAAVWTAQIIGAAIRGAVSFGIQVARVVAGWVLMGVQSLIQAGRMAAAWVIAMGPIGWIIGIVIALVALIVANWDKVKSWTVGIWNTVVGALKAAWNWILDIVKGALQWVVNLFMNWTLIGLIIKHWDQIKNIFVNGATAVVNFMKGLPGRIVGAIGNLGRLLWSKGKELIQGLVDGIGKAAGYVGNVAKNIVNGIIKFINNNIINGLNNLLEFTIAGVHIRRWRWWATPGRRLCCRSPRTGPGAGRS